MSQDAESAAINVKESGPLYGMRNHGKALLGR